MKKHITLICLIILLGCSGASDTANSEEIIYLLNSEIEQDNKTLIVLIEDKERRLKTDSIYYRFKFETQGYIDFLERLKNLSEENKINPFFKNEELTASSENYRKLSSDYNELIVKLYPEMESLVKALLNMDDVLIEENLYADYIYYHFAGIPKDIVIFSLEKRKEKVLILQNEVLFWILAEQYNAD